MPFLFEINYCIHDLIALNRTVTRLHRRIWVIFLRTLSVIAGMVQLLVGGTLLVNRGFSAVVLVNLLLAIFLLGFSLFYFRINAWSSMRMLLKDTGTITVTLDSDGIREHSAKGEGFYPYDAIISISRCRGRYILLLDKRHGIILPDAALVSSAPEALGGFLAEHCGLPIQEIC